MVVNNRDLADNMVQLACFFVNPVPTVTSVVGLRQGLRSAGSCSLSFDETVMAERRPSSSLEQPTAACSMTSSNLGSEKPFKMFEAFAVTMVDIFYVMLHDWLILS